MACFVITHIRVATNNHSHATTSCKLEITRCIGCATQNTVNIYVGFLIFFIVNTYNMIILFLFRLYATRCPTVCAGVGKECPIAFGLNHDSGSATFM